VFSLLWLNVSAVLAANAGFGAPRLSNPGAPEPCALLTTSEVEQVIGRLKGTPKADHEGAASWCDYQFANGTDAFEVWVFPADGIERGRKKAKKPIAITGLGEAAFMERGMDGLDYLSLFIKKGKTSIQLSLKTSPGDETKLRSLGEKAAARL
jgi:hypothetical protein